jgi:hypothetical protein
MSTVVLDSSLTTPTPAADASAERPAPDPVPVLTPRTVPPEQSANDSKWSWFDAFYQRLSEESFWAQTVSNYSCLSDEASSWFEVDDLDRKEQDPERREQVKRDLLKREAQAKDTEKEARRVAELRVLLSHDA